MINLTLVLDKEEHLVTAAESDRAEVRLFAPSRSIDSGSLARRMLRDRLTSLPQHERYCAFKLFCSSLSETHGHF